MNNIVGIEDLEVLFAQVERAKQQWETAIDALPELVFIVNESGYIVRANRAVENWTNILVTEVAGKTFHEIIHPSCQHSCKIDTFWQNAKQEASSFNPITEQIYDTCLDKHLLLRVRRTDQEQWNDRYTLIVIVQDVTKQYEMEQALHDNAKRFEVLNAISKSILIAQNPTQIANLVLEHLHPLVPYSFACIISFDSNLENMVPLAASGEHANHIQEEKLNNFSQHLSGLQSQLKQAFLVNDVSQQPDIYALLEHLSLSRVGSIWNVPLIVQKRFIGTIILANKKRYAFKRSYYPIVQEVAKLLTVGFRQAWLRTRLEKSNENLRNSLRANEEQLQTVSHELRSPMGIIKGYTEMLYQGLLGPLTDEQQEALQILDRKGDQLLHMVQSLFTLQKMDSANLQREDVDLNAFMHEVVNSWRVLANNKEIKLKIELEPDLPTQSLDVNFMNQLFSNLLDNAIKFSQPGDTVTVRTWTTYEDLVIAVVDEGKGIPPSVLENIFQRFYQVEKGSSQSKLGAGIGLALCQAIVTAHGGRIWAESEGENKGSTIFVSLPWSLSNDEPVV